MAAQQDLQLTDRPRRGAARQERLNAVFLRDEPKVIETGCLGDQRPLIGEVGKGRSPPQGQGIVERAHRDVGIRRK
jgi:hypothetical protein